MIEWSDHERGFAVEYGNDDVNKTIDEFNSIKNPKKMTEYLLARPSGYVCSRWEMIPYVKMGDVLKTIGDAISKEDIIEKEMTDEESREVECRSHRQAIEISKRLNEEEEDASFCGR